MKGNTVLIVLALVLANAVFVLLPKGQYAAIVLHHSAAPTGDFREIRRQHRARGWFEIAYHFVLANGSTDLPSGHLEPTWRYRLGAWSTATRSRWHNLNALHLCIVGNFEEAPVPPSLRQAAAYVVSELRKRHRIPEKNILLHRDCSPTACPGRFLGRDELLQWTVEGPPPKNIQRQHREAMNRPSLSGGYVLLPWVAFHLFLLRKSGAI